MGKFIANMHSILLSFSLPAFNILCSFRNRFDDVVCSIYEGIAVKKYMFIVYKKEPE